MKKIAFAVVVLATFASCSKESSTVSSERVEVEFTDGVISRASGNEWEAGDRIGVFMFENGTTTVSEQKANIEYYNDKSENDTKASFVVAESSNTIYYPQNDEPVDFLAYYPYDSSKVGLNDFIYEVDVTDQTDQTAIDLLLANNLVKIYLSKTPLAFSFWHTLSQLTVVVNSGEGSPSLDGLEITARGLINSADYDLVNESIELADQSTDLVILNQNAIVIPQSAEISFAIKTSENQEGFETVANVVNFQEGKRTTVTLTLNRTGVDFESDSTINDWEDSSTNPDFDAEQPEYK